MLLCVVVSSQRALLDEAGHYVNEVVIQVDGDEAVADLVAGSHGFRVKRQASQAHVLV